MSELRASPHPTTTDTTAKIACPACGSYATDVKDSRGTNNSIRRRRQCRLCQFRFTTFETAEGTLPSAVQLEIRATIRKLETISVFLKDLLERNGDLDAS